MLAAAKTAVQTVDSYDYRHLAAAKLAGDKVSTGAFLSQVRHLVAGIDQGRGDARRRPCSRPPSRRSASLRCPATRPPSLALGRLQVTDTAHPGGHTTSLTLGVTLQNGGGTWRISDMTDLGSNGTLPATPPGTPGLTAAVTAGAREVVDLLSYTRNNFTADLDRALDGLTAHAAHSAGGTGERPASRACCPAASTMPARCASVGVESASGTSLLMLVCATG